MGIQIQLEKLRSLPPLISQKRIFWVAICELMWNLKFTQKILLSDYVFTIKFILSKKRWDIMPNRDITNIRWNYKITFIYVEIFEFLYLKYSNTKNGNIKLFFELVDSTTYARSTSILAVKIWSWKFLYLWKTIRLSFKIIANTYDQNSEIKKMVQSIFNPRLIYKRNKISDVLAWKIVYPSNF